MARACWVATSHRALLEVSFENITPGEGIIAQNAHVWTVAGVYSSQ